MLVHQLFDHQYRGDLGPNEPNDPVDTVPDTVTGPEKEASLHGGKNSEGPVSVPSKGFYEILVSMEVSSSPSSLEETLLGVSVVWKK